MNKRMIGLLGILATFEGNSYIDESRVTRKEPTKRYVRPETEEQAFTFPPSEVVIYAKTRKKAMEKFRKQFLKK